ncbi:hypothetical protein L1987_32150 [Smallanthus sonchifolius]|uniref:Uncharacterized protein n=1 Tax=Smallanthus sonchifolius TaxID=185202 RepID=A0ACB9I7K4_9ASTR|nr:hypothetical protein L1987_32150 [Smallanthus sonchifolius]
MSSADQDSGGFLPPSTTPTGTNPHHLPGFTTLPLPKTTSDVSCISQESDLAAVIDRAIFNIRDAVAAATIVDTGNPIRRTKSDTTASTYRKHQTRRNPLRRTVSDVITSPATGTRSRNKVPESSHRDESPRNKRLKKMEEMVNEIEQRCRDLRRESEVKENVEDDNPCEATVEGDEGREECVGFKRLDECDEECVGFNRLDDGALRIQMRCSCRKHFEILHNHIGCFYRLI